MAENMNSSYFSTDPIAMELKAEISNSNSTVGLFGDIKWTVDFAMLLLALIVGIVWLTYLTYYNSRIMGFIITKVANFLHGGGRISLDSLSISLLSGKIMIGGFMYFHRDFTIRIQYACILFRYWRPYRLRRLGIEDFSHAEPRLVVEVTGLEIHVYNRVSRYWELDRLFGLGVFDLYNAGGTRDGKDGSGKRLLQRKGDFSGTFEVEQTPLTAEDIRKRRERASCWLTLIPRVDIAVLTARLSCGNRLLPSTLVVTFDNAKARYSVKAPSNSLDEYLHTFRGACENFKISLIKSIDYTGQYEQPPRTMGEGFVILQTAELEFYYYQDEAGVTPSEYDPNAYSEAMWPCWGSDLRLGKGTVLSYGPWADSQRDKLHRYFFPPDYQTVPCFHPPPAGVQRTFTKFDIRISTLHDSTIDLWFIPNDVLEAIHINFRQGSYCDISIPMIYEEHGYVSTIAGQLMMVESSTSLQYLSLLSSETLEFNLNLRYPRQWNELIVWEFFIRGCKTTAWLVYEHKMFLQNLFNQWISEEPPDICKFTPYTYAFECAFDDAEGIVTLNEFNWIDTSSNHEENRRGAICGRSVHLSFTLPFIDFMPDLSELKFAFDGENLHLKLFFPEQNILSQPLRALHSAAKQQWHRADIKPIPSRWKGAATSEEGWIECVYVSKGNVTLVYNLHPMPYRPSWFAVDDTSGPQTSGKQSSNSAANVMDADEIQVEIDLGPCFVQLTAAMVTFVLSLKENYFGETQTFMEVEKFGTEVVERRCGLVNMNTDSFDARKYRPLHVKVALILRQIEAQFLTFDVDSAAHCPVGRTEKFIFEMDKQFTETRMQLCLSPVVLHFVDMQRSENDGETATSLQEGRLLLTGFQLRGHALFSAEELPLDSLTLEYGWLIEILVGDLIGRLNLHHTVQIIRYLETFLQILTNKEEHLVPPKYVNVCQHMWPRSMCPTSTKDGGSPCDTEAVLKYLMTRVSVDGIHLCLFEGNSVLEVNAGPVRFAHCTEHTSTGKSGADLYLPNISVRQLVKKELKEEPIQVEDIAATAARNSLGTTADDSGRWLECGKIQARMIKLQFTAPQVDSSYYEKRREFQLKHDQRSRRLAFLHRSPRHAYTCGCVGGCVFFGDNRNGLYFTEPVIKQSSIAVQRLAVPKTEFDRLNPAYGQSILHPEELIVHSISDLFADQSPVFESGRRLTSTSSIDLGQPAKSPDLYHEASDIITDEGEDISPVEEAELARRLSEHFQSFSGTTSRSSSYVSTMSRNEDSSISLYNQLNRPIICSPLLLSAYARYLDAYVCRRNQPTVSEFTGFSSTTDEYCGPIANTTDDQYFAYFCLKRRGLNDVSFMTSTEDSEDETKLFKIGPIRERREKRSALCQEGKESTISDLQKVDVRLSVGEQCQIFTSPLGIDMIEQFLTRWSDVCIGRHPVNILMDALDRCSTRKHRQPIVSNDADDIGPITVFPIRIHADIPRIDFNIFHCGIVEKIVPLGHLSSATSLLPASILITCVEKVSAHLDITMDNATNDNGKIRKIYTANAGFDRLLFHLTQIIEKGAPTIGISKNASNIARWVHYDAMNLNVNSTPCVVLEGKVVFVDAFIRRVEHEKIKSDISSAVSPEEIKIDETDPVSPQAPPANDGSDKNQFNGLAASVTVHFGLLQPLEQAGDNWPLYDLFAPSASAWLHVLYRLIASMSAAVDAHNYARNGPFCFLLTEALDCDRIFSVRKSKFEKLKWNRKQLHECPSCQTLLALLRYCVTDDFKGYERRLSLPTELRESKILRSATVALLSHWREALCANKLVQLNEDAAKAFVKSPSLARKMESEISVMVDMEGPVSKTSPTSDILVDMNTPNTLQLQLPKSRIESLQNLAANFERFAQFDAKNAADSVPVWQHPKAEKPLLKRHTQPPSRSSLMKGIILPTTAAGAGAGEDLYEWMKREQEIGNAKNKKRKQSRYAKLSGSGAEEINPMDVPLYVYFDSLFRHLNLRKPKQKSPLFELLGHDLVADFHLHRIVATVNEPKYLGLAGSTLKRVTHTERPLIGVQQLSFRADAKYSEEEAKEATLTPLPGSKEDASPPKQAVQSIDYHANVGACDVTVGFPSVTFINQVVYAVRSTKETFDELRGRRKISDEEATTTRQDTQEDEKRRSSEFVVSARRSMCSDTTEPVTSLIQSPKVAEDIGDDQNANGSKRKPTIGQKPSSPAVVIEMEEILPQGRTSRRIASPVKRRKSVDIEKNRQYITTPQQQRQQQHWSKRMLTMLRDFQRAKRTSMRRQTPATPSPTGEAILVTTILGAIDCSKVEINAIFTELFAYATFKSVQLGHKSTESWTAVAPSQLRSSEKSVRGALKQINLTLSEAQSAHSLPVNVFTFSVAESHAIFRRTLLQQLHPSADMWRNSIGVEIGPIHVDIPLHPGSLHGLVVRGTRNISDRLPFLMTPSVVEEVVHIKKESAVGHYSRKFDKFEKVAVIHFNIGVKEFRVDAALLPSLKASYKMTAVTASGETGGEAKFQISLPNHEVAFDVKGILAESPSLIITPKILVAFPTIEAKGQYVHHSQRQLENSDILFKEGGYLQIDVVVGSVQHTLTTDLLNQLLFIQEAFTREIGDIIQKIKSEKKPTTFWASSTSSPKKQLLYSIEITVSGIQIMATTPTATAIRLNTENVRFHISNRLMRKTKGDALERVFGVTELDIYLALGQLVRVASHQEAEPEFQQVGYFKTGVSMRNVASSSEDIPVNAENPDGGGENTYLVTLNSPIIFAQPTAVDKALLIWLNYKNAYEFWNEQRSQIRPKMSRAVLDVKQEHIALGTGGSVFEQLGSPPLLTTTSLFLQVSIEKGLYICVPLYGARQHSTLRSMDVTNSALVVSLRNTGIAVCSHGALVCRGRFTEFGLQFVEDFDGNAESWSPSSLDTIDSAATTDINACFVPEGTYDICSKTINPNDDRSPARWILNIGWKMKGFDMNLNTRIWKLTSQLVSTLTSLATTENEDSVVVPYSRRDSITPDERPDSATGDYTMGLDDTAATIGGNDELSFVSSMVPGRNRKRALQKMYHDLVMKIRTLEQQEADELLVERERKKLLRLEAMLFSDSRRDVVTKLRRQAQKATTSLIDQWGLNVKSPAATADEDGSKSKRQSQSNDPQSTSSRQDGNGRRYSEFPTRQLWRQHPRTSSIDVGGPVLTNLHQAYDSGSPSPPGEQNLSFDLGDEADYLNEMDENERSKSQSPTTNSTNGGRPVMNIPRVVFEEKLPSERSATSGSVPTTTRTQPPAIDLCLDLSIYVENGRCNFRSVISKLFEQELTTAPSAAAMGTKKFEKEFKQRRYKSNSGRSERVRQSSQHTAPIHTTTIFLPGLNVKASYASNSCSTGNVLRTVHVGEMEPLSKTAPIDEDGTNSNLPGGKHGQLIMWMSLEKMPEETVVSPHILDFLEQMLEPAPVSAVSTMEAVSVSQRKSPAPDITSPITDGIGGTADQAAESLGLDASTLATVASFPLDIVFHLNVQSSQIRFTSQPLAQIECILRLPALQLVGTSRKYSELVIPSGVVPSEAGLRRNLSSAALLRPSDDDLSGGICVTVLMTGFSVSVFHMYSAGARGGTISSVVLEKRDALSIHMDTVGISLSRSRVEIGTGDMSTASSKSRSSLLPDPMTSSTISTSSRSKNSVKVSLAVDMGKAQFKYDMRRLHEILQFPKAWYRRTIFRRLFLGDEVMSSSRILTSPSVDSSEGMEYYAGETFSKETANPSKVIGRKASKPSISLSVSSDEDEMEKENVDEDEDDIMAGFGAFFRKRASNSPPGTSNRPQWDALVLFAVNFEELSIDAMMGQVMGETKLVFAGADCQGHFAVSSNKNKSVHLAFRLARAELVARQGQVSGLMNLSGFEAAAFIKKSGRSTPQSVIGASLECLDVRIDWMSSPTFMGRLTQLNCSLKDDWKVDTTMEEGKLAYVDQMSVLILGKVSWDSFRILITQTTVTDIIRICYKVNEFIDQSLQSGRMALFFHTATLPGAGDRIGGKSTAATLETDCNLDQSSEETEQPRQTVVKRFHRHWQKALALVTSLQLEASEFFPIPRNATVLGGALEFFGNDLALACYGHNFHSKEWLIFHLREPSIEFSTEAKDIVLDNGELAQLINEDMCFRLGQRQMKRISTIMGTVLCVTGAYGATHSSSIDEWLTHAFTSVLNRVYKIPSPVLYKHQYKEAFYIPPFAMHVKTKQIQAASHLATSATTSPTVESSVIADFEDHVKINVQEVLYLRRFIKAYISRQSEAGQAATAASGAGDRARQVADPTQELQKDAREYTTTNWHVEPTIRLMSLESMETTDYLWQILGIYQYAVTVSKWLQRGFLDPLDTVVASLMEQILMAEKKSKQN